SRPATPRAAWRATRIRAPRGRWRRRSGPRSTLAGPPPDRFILAGMCGIAGAIAPGGIDPSILVRMGDALEHRGPDGEAYLLGPADGLARLSRDQLSEQRGERVRAGLAHRRLTIIDLSER